MGLEPTTTGTTNQRSTNCDPLLRRQMLYPAELPGEIAAYCIKIVQLSLYLPKFTIFVNTYLINFFGKSFVRKTVVLLKPPLTVYTSL